MSKFNVSPFFQVTAQCITRHDPLPGRGRHLGIGALPAVAGRKDAVRRLKGNRRRVESNLNIIATARS
jgi:hypothetical protein